MITSDIKSIKKEFPNFRTIDEDDTYLVLMKGTLGNDSRSITAIMDKGSLGAFSVKFVVEKMGYRSRIFRSADPDASILKIRKYL